MSSIRRTEAWALSANARTLTEKIVAGIVSNLDDRRGIGHEYRAIDEQTRAGMIANWEGIVGSVLTDARAASGEFRGPNLTFAELRDQNVERCRESFHREITEWSAADWLMAVTGELGELANELKEMRKGATVQRKVLAYELADIVSYLDLLAAALGVDLDRAIREKFNLVSERIGSSRRL